jgi:hypothetical protein
VRLAIGRGVPKIPLNDHEGGAGDDPSDAGIGPADNRKLLIPDLKTALHCGWEI